jgi:hypothetical protein
MGKYLAAILLSGIRRDREDESVATTAPLAHRLIGSGGALRRTVDHEEVVATDPLIAPVCGMDSLHTWPTLLPRLWCFPSGFESTSVPGSDMT